MSVRSIRSHFAGTVRGRRRVLAAAVVPMAAAMAFAGAAEAAATVSFAAPIFTHTGTSGGAFSNENLLVSGDFRHSGHKDMIVANYYTSGVTMMLGNGDGTFQSPGVQIPVGSLIGTLAVGDFDHSGNLSFIADSATTVFVMIGDGKGNFTQKASYPIQQIGQTDIAVADLNADGNLDVAVVTPNGVQTLMGNGDGTFTMGPYSAVNNGSYGTLASVALAHCDSSTSPDLYLSDVVTGQVYALKGNGDGSFTQKGQGAASIVPGSVIAGQFRTGSGVDDAVALNEFTSPTQSMSYLQSDGNCGFLPAKSYNAGFNIDSGSVGRFSADGNLDVVSSDTSTSREIVMKGDGKGGFTQGAAITVSPSATSPQTPLVDDFNGDGKQDIATVGADSSSSTTTAVILNTTP